MKFQSKLVLSVFVFLGISAAQSETIRLSAIENSAFTNFATEIMSEAYQRIDLEIVIDPLPPARALVASNSGSKDGELFRTKDLEKRYPNLVPIRVPIFLSEWQVYSKNKEFNITGWKSLSPFIIGVRRGIATTDKGTNGMSISTADSNDSLFKMLQADRLDLIVLSKINATKVLNKVSYPEIYLASNPVEIIPVYHYVHKKNIHVVEILEQVLLDMSDEGILKEITEKHWPLLTQ